MKKQMHFTILVPAIYMALVTPSMHAGIFSRILQTLSSEESSVSVEWSMSEQESKAVALFRLLNESSIVQPSTHSSSILEESTQTDTLPHSHLQESEKLDTAYDQTQCQYPTLTSWLNKLATTVPNLEVDVYAKKDPTKDCISLDEMTSLLKASFTMLQHHYQTAAWTGETPQQDSLFFKENYPEDAVHNNMVFAEKFVVEPSSEIITYGDMHGDALSLRAFLRDLKDKGYLGDDFKLTRENIFAIMLGDYTDRGNYGLECLYTILRLQLANPYNVITLRGNHEEAGIASSYGFYTELIQKFGNKEHTHNLFKNICRIFDFMPAESFVGCKESPTADTQAKTNYLLFSHAGIETQVDSCHHALLDSKSSRACTIIRELPDNDSYYTVESMWTDYDPALGSSSYYAEGRGPVRGQEDTQELFKKHSTTTSLIQGNIRGHQHGSLTGDNINGDMMRLIHDTAEKTPRHKGVAKIWIKKDSPNFNTDSLPGGIVVTMGVGIDNKHFNADKRLAQHAYCILKTAAAYKDWKLNIHKLTTIWPNQQNN